MSHILIYEWDIDLSVISMKKYNQVDNPYYVLIIGVFVVKN
jgi:hypothetical protein